MWPYIVLYLFFAIMAITTRNKQRKSLSIDIIILGIFLVWFIGLRHHVGGDWYNYTRYFYISIPYMNYHDAFIHEDPAFWVLAQFMYKLGFNLYGVNFIISIFFVIGLLKFLKRQPNFWLGLTIAFPYLIIVVILGYIRQGAAIGFVLWGLVYLEEGKFLKFIFSITMAVLFHKTAVILIGIGLFLKGKYKFIKILAVILIGIGLWSSFLAPKQDFLLQNYVYSNEYNSSGVWIRVFMNLIPAILFLKYRKKWKRLFNDYTLVYIFSISSVLMFFLVKISSTAVDRMSLYFIPLQIMVFSKLPILLGNKVKIIIIIYYFTIMIIWLILGNFSRYWLPYRNIMFFGLF